MTFKNGFVGDGDVVSMHETLGSIPSTPSPKKSFEF
jgi:hypothetical protein